MSSSTLFFPAQEQRGSQVTFQQGQVKVCTIRKCRSKRHAVRRDVSHSIIAHRLILLLAADRPLSCINFNHAGQSTVFKLRIYYRVSSISCAHDQSVISTHQHRLSQALSTECLQEIVLQGNTPPTTTPIPLSQAIHLASPLPPRGNQRLVVDVALSTTCAQRSN